MRREPSSHRLDRYRFGASLGVEGAGALCIRESLVKILSPFSSRYIATTIVPSWSAPGRITDPGGVSSLVCYWRSFSRSSLRSWGSGEHSPTSATGTGWGRTPWHATQRAAWEAGESRWLGQSPPTARGRGHRFARASRCPADFAEPRRVMTHRIDVIELEDIGCVDRFAHSSLLAVTGGSSTSLAVPAVTCC